MTWNLPGTERFSPREADRQGKVPGQCSPAQEQLGVPAKPVDLSGFVPPFRLEFLEAAFLD